MGAEMRVLLFLILLGYAQDASAVAMSYAPLQARVAAETGDYWLRWDADSWTSGEQMDSYTGSWESSYYNSTGGLYQVDGGTPFSKWQAAQYIFDDPGTVNSLFPLNQLAYRLGTTQTIARAIGGATIGENTDNGEPFATGGYDNIFEWTQDDLGHRDDVDLFILYGGVNDLNGSLTWTDEAQRYTFAEMKRRMSQWAIQAMGTHPRTQVLMLSHQPNGFHYFGRKIDADGSGTGYDLWTWSRCFTNAKRADATMDSLAVWMMGTDYTNYGSLRRDIQADGKDSSRVFAYDLRTALKADPDSAFVAPYKFALDSLVAASVDTAGFSTLDFFPGVWDVDKLHMNTLGARHIGDLIFRNVFSSDELPNPDRNRTLYVNVDKGHNWDNAGYEELQGRPLRTVQAAIFRSFPGDSIVVKGSPQNLSTQTSDGVASLFASDIYPTRSGLALYFDEGLYYRGYPAAAVDSTDDPHFTDGTFGRVSGSTWLSYDRFTAGDTTWSAITVNPKDVANVTMTMGWDFDPTEWDTLGSLWLKDMDWDIYNLDLRGYTDPLDLENVSGLRFHDSEFTQQDGTGTYTFNWMSRGRPMELEFHDCTFWQDSVSSASAFIGLLNYPGTGGAADSSYSDSMRISVKFRGCDFIGKTDVLGRGVIGGRLGGLSMVNCTIEDAGAYKYIFTGNSKENLKGSTGRVSPKPLVFINNKINVTAHASNTGSVFRLFDTLWDSDPGAGKAVDSLTFANNLIYMKHATATAGATRIFNGTYIDSTATDIRNNTTYTEDVGGADDANTTGYSSLKLENGGSTLLRYLGGGTSSINLLSFAKNNHRGFSQTLFSTSNDTTNYFGALTGDGWTLTAYGVDYLGRYASRGPSQFGYYPLVWTSGAVQGRPAAATLQGPWDALRLVNAGVLATSTATDTDTWFEIPRIYDESSMAVARSFLDAWEKWPAANQAKVRFKVSGEPVTTITAADGSVYQTLGALDAAITATTESASDSLTASTWFTLPRPYNLNAAFQIEILRAWWRALAEANRKKIRFRVAGTDYSMAMPDTSYANGLWAVSKAISTGAETASDSLTASTWFMLPRVYDMAQSQQAGVYMDAWELWPDAKRKQVRMQTK